MGNVAIKSSSQQHCSQPPSGTFLTSISFVSATMDTLSPPYQKSPLRVSRPLNPGGLGICLSTEWIRPQSCVERLYSTLHVPVQHDGSDAVRALLGESVVPHPTQGRVHSTGTRQVERCCKHVNSHFPMWSQWPCTIYLTLSPLVTV
jgi:hypothetical protein